MDSQAQKAWRTQKQQKEEQKEGRRETWSTRPVRMHRWGVCEGRHAHHDQPFGDVLRAPVAGLAIAGPIVFLAEELPILFVVLV